MPTFHVFMHFLKEDLSKSKFSSAKRQPDNPTFIHDDVLLNDDCIDGNHSGFVLQLYLVLAFAQFL